MDIQPKKFLLIPRDVLELLARRYVSQDDAIAAASDAVAESGQAIYVAELKITVSRADRPVKVTTL